MAVITVSTLNEALEANETYRAETLASRKPEQKLAKALLTQNEEALTAILSEAADKQILFDNAVSLLRQDLGQEPRADGQIRAYSKDIAKLPEFTDETLAAIQKSGVAQESVTTLTESIIQDRVSEPYRLVIRQVDIDEAETAKNQTTDVAEIELIIMDANGNPYMHEGEAAIFKGLSGGFNRGPLPGLETDINGSAHDFVNAAYNFQTAKQNITQGGLDSRFEDQANLRYMHRMESPSYVSRGLQANEMHKLGAFGIHPDGKSGPGVVPNDGSAGCIALDGKPVNGRAASEARRYFDAYNAIETTLRPQSVEVVPNGVLLQVIAKAAQSESNIGQILDGKKPTAQPDVDFPPVAHKILPDAQEPENLKDIIAASMIANELSSVDASVTDPTQIAAAGQQATKPTAPAGASTVTAGILKGALNPTKQSSANAAASLATTNNASQPTPSKTAAPAKTPASSTQYLAASNTATQAAIAAQIAKDNATTLAEAARNNFLVQEDARNAASQAEKAATIAEQAAEAVDTMLSTMNADREAEENSEAARNTQSDQLIAPTLDNITPIASGAPQTSSRGVTAGQPLSAIQPGESSSAASTKAQQLLADNSTDNARLAEEAAATQNDAKSLGGLLLGYASHIPGIVASHAAYEQALTNNNNSSNTAAEEYTQRVYALINHMREDGYSAADFANIAYSTAPDEVETLVFSVGRRENRYTAVAAMHDVVSKNSATNSSDLALALNAESFADSVGKTFIDYLSDNQEFRGEFYQALLNSPNLRIEKVVEKTTEKNAENNFRSAVAYENYALADAIYAAHSNNITIKGTSGYQDGLESFLHNSDGDKRTTDQINYLLDKGLHVGRAFPQAVMQGDTELAEIIYNAYPDLVYKDYLYPESQRYQNINDNDSQESYSHQLPVAASIKTLHETNQPASVERIKREVAEEAAATQNDAKSLGGFLADLGGYTTHIPGIITSHAALVNANKTYKSARSYVDSNYNKADDAAKAQMVEARHVAYSEWNQSYKDLSGKLHALIDHMRADGYSAVDFANIAYSAAPDEVETLVSYPDDKDNRNATISAIQAAASGQNISTSTDVENIVENPSIAKSMGDSLRNYLYHNPEFRKEFSQAVFDHPDLRVEKIVEKTTEKNAANTFRRAVAYENYALADAIYAAHPNNITIDESPNYPRFPVSDDREKELEGFLHNRKGQAHTLEQINYLTGKGLHVGRAFPQAVLQGDKELAEAIYAAHPDFVYQHYLYPESSHYQSINSYDSQKSYSHQLPVADSIKTLHETNQPVSVERIKREVAEENAPGKIRNAVGTLINNEAISQDGTIKPEHQVLFSDFQNALSVLEKNDVDALLSDIPILQPGYTDHSTNAPLSLEQQITQAFLRTEMGADDSPAQSVGTGAQVVSGSATLQPAKPVPSHTTLQTRQAAGSNNAGNAAVAVATPTQSTVTTQTTKPAVAVKPAVVASAPVPVPTAKPARGVHRVEIKEGGTLWQAAEDAGIQLPMRQQLALTTLEIMRHMKENNAANIPSKPELLPPGRYALPTDAMIAAALADPRKIKQIAKGGVVAPAGAFSVAAAPHPVSGAVEPKANIFAVASMVQNGQYIGGRTTGYDLDRKGDQQLKVALESMYSTTISNEKQLESAIEKFQKDQKTHPDGIVGKGTLRKLNAAMKSRNIVVASADSNDEIAQAAIPVATQSNAAHAVS